MKELIVSIKDHSRSNIDSRGDYQTLLHYFSSETGLYKATIPPPLISVLVNKYFQLLALTFCICDCSDKGYVGKTLNRL